MTLLLGVDPAADAPDYSAWTIRSRDGLIVVRDGEGWNPRYLAYVIAHRAISPEEMMARDRTAWPGGCMCGFIAWIGERWAEWERATSFPRNGAKDERVHREFDAWLAEQVICA